MDQETSWQTQSFARASKSSPTGQLSPRCVACNYTAVILVSWSFDCTRAFPTLSCFVCFLQIFVKGEFIGGCDILMAMHQDGELEKLFANKLKK